MSQVKCEVKTISIECIAKVIEKEFDLTRIGSHCRDTRRAQGIYLCNRDNTSFKKLKGKQGQLHVVLQGITRTQVKNMLKGVHTLKQVKDAPNLLIEIDLDNILALDTFYLRTFVEKLKITYKIDFQF